MGASAKCVNFSVLAWKFSIMGHACCAGCWDVTEDHHIIGGTQLPSIKTEESCKEQCIKNSTCVAIDWHANDDECWIHDVSEKLVVEKHFSYSLHRLNPVCSGWSWSRHYIGVVA